MLFLGARWSITVLIGIGIDHQAAVKRLVEAGTELYKTCGLHGRGSGRSSQRRNDMTKQAKNTICIWYDRDAEEAARFYAKTFPDSSVGTVHRAPADFHSGKKGDVLTVEFTVMGIPCIGLNGG